jgi:hypothetical protein
LIEAGTSLATAALAPDAEPEADVPVPVLALVPVPLLVAAADDEVVAAPAPDADDDELLLPHPTIAAAHSSVTAADSHVLVERIALLLIVPRKSGERIGNARPFGTGPNRPATLA